MISGHLIFTGFRRLTDCQRDPRVLGCHSVVSKLRYTITCSVLGLGLGYGVPGYDYLALDV